LKRIIVAIHVGAMKIYATTLEALRRKESGGEDRMYSDHHKN
jgi:hypothetical protein